MYRGAIFLQEMSFEGVLKKSYFFLHTHVMYLLIFLYIYMSRYTGKPHEINLPCRCRVNYPRTHTTRNSSSTPLDHTQQGTSLYREFLRRPPDPRFRSSKLFSLPQEVQPGNTLPLVRAKRDALRRPPRERRGQQAAVEPREGLAPNEVSCDELLRWRWVGWKKESWGGWIQSDVSEYIHTWVRRKKEATGKQFKAGAAGREGGREGSYKKGIKKGGGTRTCMRQSAFNILPHSLQAQVHITRHRCYTSPSSST